MASAYYLLTIQYLTIDVRRVQRTLTPVHVQVNVFSAVVNSTAPKEPPSVSYVLPVQSTITPCFGNHVKVER